MSSPKSDVSYPSIYAVFTNPQDTIPEIDYLGILSTNNMIYQLDTQHFALLYGGLFHQWRSSRLGPKGIRNRITLASSM